MALDRRLTVYLIRHGETCWNREGRCQGVTDVPLTEKGRCQARAVAETLAQYPLSLILSGPLQRTRDMAAIIAESQGLSVETREELREWHQGELEGLTGAELLSKHRAYFERWFQDPAGAAPPGGETLRSLQDRVWPVIDGLRDRALDGPVAVVSHTMTIGTIICAALGLDLAHIHRLKFDLASRSTITFSPFGLFSAWVLTNLNDRHHLPEDLRQEWNKEGGNQFFDCACAVFGTQHLLYGSDHFFHGSRWRSELNRFLADLPLSPADRHAIVRGNAERLLS